MSTETVFFSYSRDNEDFVMKLAGELRDAGANIWLDQLDIKPGTRWDRSIEKALISSQTLLVVLSKSSVESNNVMDEVSFALEEGKPIVPILLEECDIPFRLRRLQFADFTSDYNKGIRTLIQALDLDKEVASKLAADVPKKPISKVKETPKKVVTPSPAPTPSATEVPTRKQAPKKKKKSKKILIAFIAIIALSIAGWQFSEGYADERDWELTINKNTFEAFDSHLEDFPECMHIEEAQASIKRLVAEQKDKDDWDKALEANTFEGFDQHIESFSPCKHDATAKIKLGELAAIHKEKTDWDDAVSTNTQEAIKSFIKEYPSGAFVQQADSLLIAMDNSKEKADWDIAIKSNSTRGFKKYLTDYPKGTYVSIANTKITNINASVRYRNDVANWNSIWNAKHPSYFSQHLRTYGNCSHSTTARAKIKLLEEDIAYYVRISKRRSPRIFYKYLEKYGKSAVYFTYIKGEIYNLSKGRATGWVWIGHATDDNRYIGGSRNYNNKFARFSQTIPAKGDLIESLNQNSIYTVTTAQSKTTQFVYAKQVVVVLDVKGIVYANKKGKGYWVQIARI